MFLALTFQNIWRRRQWSPHNRQQFKQQKNKFETEIQEKVRLQKHHLNAVDDIQKVKRNYLLERRTFL